MNVDLDLEEKLYWENYEKAERESLASAPLLMLADKIILKCTK